MRVSTFPVRVGFMHMCTVAGPYRGPEEPVVDLTICDGYIVAWLRSSGSRIAYGNVGLYYEVPAHAKWWSYDENISAWWKL